MTKYCIVVAHSSNLIGYLNNAVGGVRCRIDYRQLLDYVVGERKLLKAFMVSQQDTSIVRSVDSLQSNQKFLQTLKKFGWEPLKVSFNSQTKEMTDIINTVWTNVVNELQTPEGELLIDPDDVDIVFVTGAQLWGSMVNTFSEAGFNVEVAYPKKSTSKLLYSNFAFLDLTNFIVYSNECIKNKQLQSQSINSVVMGE